MSAIVHVAVVIVNYRTPLLVTQCLASLANEAGPDMKLRVIVGDAQSGDDSVAIIQKYIREQGIGDWVLCFDIGKNGGFAFGNNAIFERHVADDPDFDFVYFLNPDTYIHPGAVRALSTFLSDHHRVGVAGSRVENPDGSWRAYAFRFPKPWREFFRGARIGALNKLVSRAAVNIRHLDHTRQVDWVTGASFMMPRPILDQVGLMDDGYFLYFEETDLMARVRAAGFEVWHVAESRVVHLAGQSTGVRSDDVLKRLSPIWLESRQRFFKKHHGRAGFWRANLFFLVGDLLYRAHRLLRRKPVDNPPHMWQDYLASGRK